MQPCSRTDRIMMSPFTRASRVSRSRAHSPAARRACPSTCRASHRPSATPDSSAIRVAQATPATPSPRPSTNHTSSATFSPFCNSCSACSARVRSTAISPPVIAYNQMVWRTPRSRDRQIVAEPAPRPHPNRGQPECRPEDRHLQRDEEDQPRGGVRCSQRARPDGRRHSARRPRHAPAPPDRTCPCAGTRTPNRWTSG